MTNPLIVISTELGILNVELYTQRAPITVNNFLRYVKAKIFDDSHFFRIVTPDNEQKYDEQDPNSFVSIKVLQGGVQPQHPRLLSPIAHESTEQTGILHKHGVLSMARFEPGTADGSFFICIGDQPSLDFGGGRYQDGFGFAAFGRVIKGESVLKALYARSEAQEYLQRPIAITQVRLCS